MTEFIYDPNPDKPEKPKSKKRGAPIGNQYAKGCKTSGAPLGNQNAKGSLTSGRKPKPEWTDEIIENLGKELVSWAKSSTDSLFLQEFAILKKLDYDEFRGWKDRIVFKPYYDEARYILGMRQVRTTNKENGLREGIVHRFMTLYFKDVKEEERANKAFEIELKYKLESQSRASDDQEARHKELMDQIRALQNEAAKIKPSSSQVIAKYTED